MVWLSGLASHLDTCHPTTLVIQQHAGWTRVIQQHAGCGWTRVIQQHAGRREHTISSHYPFLSIFCDGVAPLLCNTKGIFYQAGQLGNTPDEARTHFGALTQVLIGAMFGSAQPVLLAFPLERPVFLREYRTGTYGVLPYFLAKTFVELIMSFFTMAEAVLIGYYLMDFQGPVMLHILVAFGLSVVASSVALFLGCAVKEVTLALELTPLIFVPQIMFAGFFIKMSQIPSWLSWAQYLCSLKFAINLGLVVEFGGSTGCTDATGWTDITHPQYNSTELVAAQALQAGRCEASAQLLTDNDIVEEDWWVYVVVLLALFVGFRSFAAMLLAAKAR
jgi:hypothetical protein